MAVGARDVPTDVGDAAVLWYVLLWEPLWLLGGLLFLAATRQAARTTSHREQWRDVSPDEPPAMSASRRRLSGLLRAVDRRRRLPHGKEGVARDALAEGAGAPR